MVLTKDELIAALRSEVRILLHLASKVDPGKLDYRPTPKQRSLLELLQYLAVMGPIHARTIKSGVLDMDLWRKTWQTEKARAKAMNLEQVKEEIERLSGFFAELLGGCSDAELRTEMEIFGSKGSRGSLWVSLVLGHYTAYRMQLFLYLKACGREELSTMNLWAGRDAA
jgi:hypothetical protein